MLKAHFAEANINTNSYLKTLTQPCYYRKEQRGMWWRYPWLPLPWAETQTQLNLYSMMLLPSCFTICMVLFGRWAVSSMQQTHLLESPTPRKFFVEMLFFLCFLLAVLPCPSEVKQMRVCCHEVSDVPAAAFMLLGLSWQTTWYVFVLLFYAFWRDAFFLFSLKSLLDDVFIPLISVHANITREKISPSLLHFISLLLLLFLFVY